MKNENCGSILSMSLQVKSKSSNSYTQGKHYAKLDIIKNIYWTFKAAIRTAMDSNIFKETHLSWNVNLR